MVGCDYGFSITGLPQGLRYEIFADTCTVSYSSYNHHAIPPSSEWSYAAQFNFMKLFM